MKKTSEMTKQEAIERFRELTRRYGLQWRADVPPAAWEELARVNRLLDAEDRREALGLPTRRTDRAFLEFGNKARLV